MNAGREPVNVADHLALAALKHPNGLAIVSARDGAFPPRTFAELASDVSACSRLLREEGIRAGDKVLLMVRPGLELVGMAFALFSLGAPPVVIDSGMGLKSLLQCIRRTKPDALIGIPLALLLTTIFRGTFREVRTKVIFSCGNFLRKLDPHRHDAPLNVANVACEDLAAILFTSGSTGPPKGVSYEHGTFASQINLLKENFGIPHGETDLVTLPVFALFNPALGMKSVIPDMNPRHPAKAKAENLVNAILKHEVNSTFGSPIIWKKLAAHCETENIVLPSIKRIFLAGVAVPPSLVERLVPLLPNARIFMPYGATEALPVSVCDAKEALAVRSSTERGEGTCLGKPLPSIDIHMLPVRNSPIPNLSEVEPVPIGEVGEITVGGPVVTKRYHRMPGATFDAKVYHENQTLHRMGDLGYFDKGGRLRFLGRKAERVLTAEGPLETERAEPIANKLSKVRRSALVGIGSGQKQEPVIVIEPKPGHFPRNGEEEKSFSESILNDLHEHEHLRSIKRIFFEKRFPVDSRHNAKIHRLALARKWSKKAKTT